MQNAIKKMIILLVLVLVLPMALAADEKITPTKGTITPSGYNVYKSTGPVLADQFYPEFPTFIYVFDAAVKLDKESTKLASIFDAAKKEELEKILYASIEKTSDDARAKAFVDKEVERVTKLEAQVHNAVRGLSPPLIDTGILGQSAISMYFKAAGRWLDCTWVPLDGDLEVKKTYFTYCAETIPGNRYIWAAKSQEKSITSNSEFQMQFADIPSLLKSDYKNTTYNNLNLESNGFTKVDPKIAETPAKPGITSAAGTGIKTAAVRVWQGGGRLISSIADDIKDYAVLRPNHFRWNNPEESDKIELTWSEITNSSAKGYIVEMSFNNSSGAEETLQFPIMEVKNNFIVFNKGEVESNLEFREDVEYAFNIFTYKDEEIPSELAALKKELLVPGGPELPIQVDSETTKNLNQNLEIVVVRSDGKEIRPDSETNKIYVNEKNFSIKVKGLLEENKYGVYSVKDDAELKTELENCKNVSSHTLETATAQDWEQKDFTGSMTFIACQDKASYIDLDGEVNLIQPPVADKVVFDDVNPSPEFASVEVIYLPELKATQAYSPTTELYSVKVENINPQKELFFSVTKDCEEIRLELEAELERQQKEMEKEFRDERKSLYEKTFDVIKGVTEGVGKFIRKERDYFTAETRYRSTADVLGSSVGGFAGEAVVTAQSFWGGMKNSYSSFVDSMKEAKDSTSAAFRQKGIAVPGDALFLPLIIDPSKPYVLPKIAFTEENEGRNTWYISSIKQDGKINKIGENNKVEVHVCQFTAGSVITVGVASLILGATGVDQGSGNKCDPQINLLGIKRAGESTFTNYLDVDRWLNTLNTTSPDEVSVKFNTNPADECPVYQWTLELWKTQPSKAQYCNTKERDCIRIQVESGGLIDKDGKKVEAENKDNAVPYTQPIQTNFTFKSSEPVDYADNTSNTLGAAIGDSKKVWLRVEACNSKDIEECRKNNNAGWLDSKAYEIDVGKPAEPKPEPPVAGTECTTIPECLSKLDLKMVNDIFKKAVGGS